MYKKARFDFMLDIRRVDFPSMPANKASRKNTGMICTLEKKRLTQRRQNVD